MSNHTSCVPRHEECFLCGELTGRCGECEDSLYDDNGHGPYCEECYCALLSAEDGDV
jgi:hypothetical protein